MVSPTKGKGKPAKVPLFVNQKHLADLDFKMYLDLDTSGDFLKAVRTDFAVYSVLDKQPLFRLDYQADMHTVPVAHWQFHAERGSLTHLLTLANQHRPKVVENPHTISKLHFPVGGERFRPCMEDVLQFLIEECGVDSQPNWREAVDKGREKWRRFQLRSVVRDLQEEAAAVLRREGWTVVAPEQKLVESMSTLSRW
ncbi:MAG: hypothetical protein KF680_06960 [Cryobacterium sp.]|nr:hypothetical protein [Cryobacterium sp.]